LTEREREVLRLVATGATNKEMARQLFVAEATVKSHLVHIFTKLGVDNRARAVALAQETGLICGHRPQNRKETTPCVSSSTLHLATGSSQHFHASTTENEAARGASHRRNSVSYLWYTPTC